MKAALLRILGIKSPAEVRAEVLDEPHIAEARRLVKHDARTRLERELAAIERTQR